METRKKERRVRTFETHTEQQLKAAIDAAEAAFRSAADGEKEVARQNLEIAQLELTRFRVEHDATGALKGERFGRDLANHLRELGLERSREEPLNREAIHRTHFIQVNMGELDRLNKAGHEMGNMMLAGVAEHLNRCAQDALAESGEQNGESERRPRVSIYRLSGNDFGILLMDVDDAVAQKVRSTIKNELPIPGRPDMDPAPLSISSTSGKETLDLLEHAPPDGKEGKEFIYLLREETQTANDVAKFLSRRQRLLDKIQHNKEEARSFYDQFLKKTLGGGYAASLQKGATEPLAYDDVAGVVKDEHKAREAALNDASKLLHERSALAGREKRSLANVIYKKTHNAHGSKNPADLFPSEPDTAAEATPEAGAESDFRERLKTRGQKQLEDKRQAVEQAASQGEQAQKIAQLELDIESAKRNAGTGLYERGVFFEKMEQRFAEGKPQTAISIDMAFLKYFDHIGGREVGDHAILQAAKILEDVAEWLGQQTPSVHAEAYRVGGDEFSLAFESADPEVLNRVKEEITKACHAAGKIPGSQKNNYHPESLQMSLGSIQTTTLEAFRLEMENEGIFQAAHQELTAEERQKLMDLFVHLADKESEVLKTVNRFRFLIDRCLESKESQPDNYQDLLRYSQKAIFGADGSDKIAEWVERRRNQSRKAPAQLINDINQEILEYVLAQLEDQDRREQEAAPVIDQLIEVRVRLRFMQEWNERAEIVNLQLRTRIKELEERQAELSRQLKTNISNKDAARVEELRQKLHRPTSAAA